MRIWLLAYRAQDLTRIIGDAQPIEKMETDFMLRVLEHIKVYESGTLVVVFMEGTEIELKILERYGWIGRIVLFPVFLP